MRITFNLLNDSRKSDLSLTHLRGLIGEEIVAYLLRKKLNLYVIRPFLLISKLNELKANNSRSQFILSHTRTMDFFGVWPSIVPLTEDFNVDSLRTSVIDFFFENTLSKHLLSDSNQVLRGYIVEVKSSSSMSDSRPNLSPKQVKMIQIGKKSGFDAIIAQVVYLPNYEIRVRLFDGARIPLNPLSFEI